MACLPAYNPTGSPHGTSLDAGPTTYRSPTAHLQWWEAAAVEIIRTEQDFDLVTRTIKFIPVRDPTTAATLLSTRPEGWLSTFLEYLCRDRAFEEPPCHSSWSTAEAIVAIIRPSHPVCAPRLDQSKFIPELLSNPRVAAEGLDQQIHTIFCRTTISDWTAWICGYQCEIIPDFLDTVLDFRDFLARSARQDTLVAQNLEILEQASLNHEQDLYATDISRICGPLNLWCVGS